MKIVIQFLDHTYKSEIITPFLGIENCEATETELVVPKLVKIDYSKENLLCYCFSLNVAEKIISSVCNCTITDTHGEVKFVNSLYNMVIETEILDFDNILKFVSNYKVQNVNTNNGNLKALIELSEWMTVDLMVDKKAILNINFKNVIVHDNIKTFCERVKNHPLIFLVNLKQYFNFGIERKLIPKIEKFCFYKILESANGYKKYSNFINDCKDKIKIEYEEGKSYLCLFDGGKIDFILLNIADEYPKKIIMEIDEINDIELLTIIQKHFSMNVIDLYAEVINIKFSIDDLLNKMGFEKDNGFFIFTNKNMNMQYDINNFKLTIKKEIKNINKNILNLEKEEMEQILTKMIGWCNDGF